MKRTYVSLMAFGLAAVAAVAVYAQQPAATPPPPKACTLTPAQIAEGRSVAIAFQTSTGDARVALADPTYNQHNPAFKKRAEEAKKTDFEEFRDNFSSAALPRARAVPAAVVDADRQRPVRLRHQVRTIRLRSS